ncbi:MAG: formate dehydrogenase accessory sulfurtransferase FdhD [Armatimonadetes bacterium]|nr:formate dehydrogenase accessory sulfurtransferase FdhD [Armatimonadota bacterium]
MHEQPGVVIERAVTITIDGVGSYTLMATPCDTMALAVGFALSEGIISSTRDINLLRCCDDDPSAIRMQLARVPEGLTERNMIVASSCGMCGSANVEETIAGLPKVGDSLRVPVTLLLQALAEMKSRQVIFERTGGTHAAALFSGDGAILAFAEDIGRHNALDKVIGRCCLEENPTAGCGAALSGRVSFEMIVKAARAGIELVAAVSAPSSLAIDAAERCGITLCAFVRGDRATVYTHGPRVTHT